MAIAKLTKAQKAYDEWMQSHKVNMRVYTNEEMFCMGYELRDNLIRDMGNLIDDLMKRLDMDMKKEKDEPKDQSVRPPVKQASTKTSKRAPKQG